jgi:hypothetical protein
MEQLTCHKCGADKDDIYVNICFKCYVDNLLTYTWQFITSESDICNSLKIYKAVGKKHNKLRLKTVIKGEIYMHKYDEKVNFQL